MVSSEAKFGEEQRTPKKPQKIVTNNPHLEIIVPNQNQRVFLHIFSDGTHSVRVEQLSKKEECFAIKEEFTKVVRDLISNSLGLEAARLTKGEEVEIGTISSLEAEFDAGVNYLLELNLSNRDVKRLIEEAASQFSIGEQRMGELSPPVKEQVARLKGRVEEIYNEKAQAAREARSR